MPNKPEYSNYFTVVIYAEFKKIDKLLELGQIYFSPIHFYQNQSREPPKNDLIVATNEWILFGMRENKPHQHLLLKTAKKYTENTFLVELMRVLENDITGIAIHQGKVFVKEPYTLIRYFYHLDNPNKQHFNFACAIECVMPSFTKEVTTAFDVEITHLITTEIMMGNIKTLPQLLQYNENSLVFEEYLRRGKNLYFVMSLFKEFREIKKVGVNYEEISTDNRKTLKLLDNQVG